MDWAAVELAKTARWVVTEAAATQPGEQVLIVADFHSDLAVVEALTAAVTAAGAEPTVAFMPARAVAGAPATEVVQHAVDGASLVICPTTTVIHFSPRIRQALDEKRIRLISISIDRETMTKGAAAADPTEVAAITTRLYEVLAPARELRFCSPSGTDFTCSVADRLPNFSIGLAREPGKIGTFPFGEVPHAPIEGSMNGTVVYDGPVHSIGHLTSPIRLEVRAGRVVAIEGGPEAERLRALIDGVENADVVAEVSVGTNPKANLAGDIQEAKKRWGTAHVGLGNSTGLRGLTFSPLHIDGLILRPTVWADGQLIVDDGRLLV
ncbi:MAG: aminopeptidase [Dehalococcoidia bacterium]|nr:MAG: aminopeptidase [Dehalococcoidia bacterium]